MPSPREILLITLLVAVSGLAVWMQYGAQIEERKSRGAASDLPDYTVEGLTVTTMDSAGRPGRRLTAPKGRHYPNNGGTELDQPLLTVFREPEPPWLIRSETGWISEDGKELRLRGEVHIDREAGQETRPLHLTTWDLLVHPDEEYARTDRPVHAASMGEWLRAGGAEIWYGTPWRVELSGRARMQIAIP